MKSAPTPDIFRQPETTNFSYGERTYPRHKPKKRGARQDARSPQNHHSHNSGCLNFYLAEFAN